MSRRKEKKKINLVVAFFKSGLCHILLLKKPKVVFTR